MEEVPQALPRFGVKRRAYVYPLALMCLAGPLILLIFYVFPVASTETKAALLLIALLAGTMGGTTLIWVLKNWERHMRLAVTRLVEQKYRLASQLSPEQAKGFHQEMEKMRLGYEHQIDLLHSSVAKSKEQVQELNLEMDKKLEQMRLAYLEFEDLRKEYTLLEEEYRRYQSDIQGQLGHKDSLLEDYQHTIAEQREVIEKKQRYVEKLEGKVRDLMYEIRSLLQLEDPILEKNAPTYQPDGNKGKPYDLSLQLTRFLEMAESFTGADHLGGRFLNSGANRYAIDVRQLFDKLSHEHQRMVFVYSQSEQRFLFMNEPIRARLGWSIEKIIKDFPQLVVKGFTGWKQAIETMEASKHQVLPIILRHKSGEEVSFDCYMGLITKGPCSGSIMGMFV